MLSLGDDSMTVGFNALGLANGSGDIRKSFRYFPGLLEMLPHRTERPWTESVEWWQTVRDEVCSQPITVHPVKAGLETAHAHIGAFLQDKPWRTLRTHRRFFYIAGRDDETYVLDRGWPCLRPNSGDGTVPWTSADTHRIWSSTAHHSLLLHEESTRTMIREMLRGDYADRSPEPPRELSQWQGPERPSRARPPSCFSVSWLKGLLRRPGWDGVEAALFGRAGRRPLPPEPPPISLQVTHGDLRHSRWPVLIGHVKGDAPGDTLAAADRVLDGAVLRLIDSGAFTGEEGDHLLVTHPRHHHPGVLMVGLGAPVPDGAEPAIGAVVQGLIQLGLSRSDGQQGLSSVMVSFLPGITVRRVLERLVDAIGQANRSLPEDRLFRHLEVIELFEDRAIAAMVAARRLSSSGPFRSGMTGRIHLAPRLQVVAGGLTNRVSHLWRLQPPHQVRIARAGNAADNTHHLRFEVVRGRSGASVFRRFINWEALRGALDGVRSDHPHQPGVAGRILWHQLLPPAVREILRDGGDLLLQLDRSVADLPWEWLTEADDQPPAFTRLAITRQLLTPRPTPRRSDQGARQVLVLADLESSAPLPGARSEGKAVSEVFRGAGWNVDALIGGHVDYRSVLEAMSPMHARVLHIAAHGVLLHEGEHRVPAIVLPGGRGTDGQRPVNTMRANDITTWEVLPQVVFLNTCYSGVLTAAANARTEAHSPRFAVDIATELIQAGVRAVVVTGWEVDDRAAARFAEHFWWRMVLGAPLGEAARDARADIWREFPNTATFAAYQVYGDTSFQLVERGRPGDPGSPQEVLDRLDRFVFRASPAAGESTELAELSRQVAVDGAAPTGEICRALGRAWAVVGTDEADQQAVVWFERAVDNAIEPRPGALADLLQLRLARFVESEDSADREALRDALGEVRTRLRGLADLTGSKLWDADLEVVDVALSSPAKGKAGGEGSPQATILRLALRPTLDAAALESVREQLDTSRGNLLARLLDLCVDYLTENADLAGKHSVGQDSILQRFERLARRFAGSRVQQRAARAYLLLLDRMLEAGVKARESDSPRTHPVDLSIDVAPMLSSPE